MSSVTSVSLLKNAALQPFVTPEKAGAHGPDGSRPPPGLRRDDDVVVVRPAGAG